MRAQRGRCWRVGAVTAAAAALLAGSPEQGSPEPGRGPTGPARAPAPAPACRAEPDPADAAAVSAMVEALRRLPPRRTPDGEAVVTLDNRGFGYAPAPDPFAVGPGPGGR